MTRTDIHRPAELITEDYTYRFARDLQGPLVGRDGNPTTAGQMYDLLFKVEGRHFWADHQGSHCDHCGAAIRYAAYLVHNPTGDVITVGETCLDNRFERSTADFQRLRKAAELDRQQQRLLKAERAWLVQNLDMVWLTDLREDDHYILHDMRRKLRAYGSLSDRQIAFAKRLLIERLDLERKNQDGYDDDQNKIRIPDQFIGRVTFTGTILATKWVESDYGDQFKALVEVTTDNGSFTLWGTVPMAQKTTEKGESITWVGRIERARDDETHGYFSRPRVA